MIGFTKDIEYALLCLSSMENCREKLFSAAALADAHSISPSLVAKILQRLHKAGIVNSVAGVRGGYSMAKSGNEISLNEVAGAIKEDFHVIDCVSKDGCARSSACSIKPGMQKVQTDISQILMNTSIADLSVNK